MNNYILTILYASHGLKESNTFDFSMKTLSSDQIQIINVQEEDIHDPRKYSLKSIPKAAGIYTIMLDEGDRFDSSFLDRMLEAAQKPGISFVMPALTCSVGTHVPHFALQKPVNLLIDTSLEQPIFPLELHGLMFNTKLLDRIYRQTLAKPEQEKQMILLALAENPVFYYLGSCSCIYAQPRECDASFGIKCYTRNWYYDPFEQFLLPLLETSRQQKNGGNRLLQYMALHMIESRINANTNNSNKHIIPTEDVPAYMELFSRVLQFVDTEVILAGSCQAVISSPKQKILYLQLKKRDFSYRPDLICLSDNIKLMCDGAEFGELSLLAARICVLEYRNGCLEIDCEVNDFFSDKDVTIYAEFGKKQYKPVYNSRYSLTKCFGVTYNRMKTFHVSIDRKSVV